MRRLLKRRGVWLLIGVVVVVIGLALVLASRAGKVAASKIEERIQLPTSVGSVVPGMSSTVLYDVQIGEEDLSAHIDRLEVDASLFGLGMRGASAVHAIDVKGAQAKVDLSSDAFLSLMKRLQPKPIKSAQSNQERKDDPKKNRRARSLVARDVEVHVRDAQGPLISMSGAKAKFESGTVALDAESLMAGSDDADHIALKGLSAELVSDGGWKVKRATVGGGDVRWVDSLQEDNAGERSDTLPRRLLSSIRNLRPEPGSSTEAQEVSDDATSGVFARVTKDLLIELESMSVESLTPSGEVERLDSLVAKVQGTPEDAFDLKGEGRTSRGGIARWDMRVWPKALRAEGSLSFNKFPLSLVAPLLPDIPWHEPDKTMLSASLELKAASATQISVSGKVGVSGAALFAERIAPEPVRGIDVEIEGKGSWSPTERLLTIDEARAETGGVSAILSGEVRRNAEYYTANLLATVPPESCTKVLRAIPKDLLGKMHGFALDGSWGSQTTFTIDSRDFDATVLDIRVANGCRFVSAPAAASVRRFRNRFWYRVVEPDETVFKMVTGPKSENWTPLAEISPFIVQSVVSHEDGGFYRHGGFAPWAIRDALVRNLKEGRFVLGASTISMQLTKNIFLNREKTLGRKAQEVVLTWWLENEFTKDEIIELYLNVIEYGPGVYGITNASKYYFGRMPEELSPAEAAFLACVLPSPKRFHISYERGELTNFMHNKMRRLMEHMGRRERIGQKALDHGLAELPNFSFYKPGDPAPAPRELPANFDAEWADGELPPDETSPTFELDPAPTP